MKELTGKLIWLGERGTYTWALVGNDGKTYELSQLSTKTEGIGEFEGKKVTVRGEILDEEKLFPMVELVFGITSYRGG